MTSPFLVEKLIPRNNALSVLLHRVQYLVFVAREGNQAIAFSSQLYVAQIPIPIIESKGVPRRHTRGSTHRGLALTPGCRGTMKLQDDCNGGSVAKQTQGLRPHFNSPATSYSSDSRSRCTDRWEDRSSAITRTRGKKCIPGTATTELGM